MLSIPKSVLHEIHDLKNRYESLYLIDAEDFAIGRSGLTSLLVIRPMTRREFNLFTEVYDLDPVAANQRALKLCLLTQIELSNSWKAGIDDYIVASIAKISGFSSEEDLLAGIETGRQEAVSLDSAITIFICKAFPSLAPTDVDNMNFYEQMKHVSMAEVLLGKPVPYDQFIDNAPEVKESTNHSPHHGIPDIPVPEGMSSHGSAPYNQNPALNRPLPQPHKNVTVTPENLKQVMMDSREMLGG